jgi:hypothetical protein
MKIKKIQIYALLIFAVSVLSQDGPYLLFHTDLDSVITVISDISGRIIIDTLKTPLKVKVTKPGQSGFFEVPVNPTKIEGTCVYTELEDIFAVSDIEGNFSAFVEILNNNGIIDKELNWTFGKGHLVLNGDMVDRGEFVTQVLWLIRKLETEAEQKGGKVHYLLGNHDVMLMQGDDRYATEKYRDLAKKTGRKLKDYFGRDTYFGKWMRGKNAVEKIGETIFVHGGLSIELIKSDISIREVNELLRNNIDVPDSLLNEDSDLIFGSFGPLWYRGLITDQKKYEKIKITDLDKILDYYKADRIVAGHCIVDEVSDDFKGKVVRIDVDHYEEESCGIFIEKGKIYKAMKTGKRVEL